MNQPDDPQQPSSDLPDEDSQLPEPEERAVDGPSDAELLHAIENRDPTRSSQIRNFIYLIISIVLFGLIGSVNWSLTLVVLLLVVIGLHELGHLVAMKLCNYRNLKILFIPMLGGVASGEPQDQDGFKLALISLAGPVSGLPIALVALVLHWLVGGQIFLQLAMLCVFLNLLNLLPIMPLDGGHFINETLFSRFPKGELAFRLLAVGLLALLAVTLDGFLLWILVAFLAIGIKPSYQMANAVQRLRQIPGMQAGDLTARKIALIRQELRQVNPFYDQNPGILHQTWQRVNKYFPSPGQTGMLFALYIASGGLFLLIGLAMIIFLGNAFAQP